ncbi:hypothetical protein BCB4_0062 [Bacillus phage B4]|uniref:Uncharacterized protein n=2 Tax=Bequatrovirus B4 TaxID=1918005 RepID=J9PRE7_9CAUD|nr:hypothetical protein BCB4_0062 [Bacillus phage B4]YP_009783656.1 hypothetical protein QLX26_gp060 [Bacillus phage B5S]AEW47294.1 hypothetical protein B5S_0060 [Bacillus phage B5S]AEZ65855.1 hypothetical protein BCB4_0062 [Bacillus phage B4]
MNYNREGILHEMYSIYNKGESETLLQYIKGLEKTLSPLIVQSIVTEFKESVLYKG